MFIFHTLKTSCSLPYVIIDLEWKSDSFLKEQISSSASAKRTAIWLAKTSNPKHLKCVYLLKMLKHTTHLLCLDPTKHSSWLKDFHQRIVISSSPHSCYNPMLFLGKFGAVVRGGGVGEEVTLWWLKFFLQWKLSMGLDPLLCCATTKLFAYQDQAAGSPSFSVNFNTTLRYKYIYMKIATCRKTYVTLGDETGTFFLLLSPGISI